MTFAGSLRYHICKDMFRGLKTITISLTAVLLALAGCGEKSTGPENNIPIRIVDPEDGDVLRNPVNVVARAGIDFGITDVDFYIDGELVWSDDSAPYEYYWNIFGYQNNSEHVIEAVGNAADSSYTSSAVTVTISLEAGLLYVSSYVPNSEQAFGVTNYQGARFATSAPAR